MVVRLLRLGLLLVVLNLSWFVFLLLAGRTLTEADFGRLTLVTSAVALMVSLGDFGLTSTLARWFSRHPLRDWNWLQAFRRWLPFSAAFAAAGGVVLSLAYGVSSSLAAVAGLTALSQIVSRAFGAGLLKAHDRAVLGILAEKGGRLALPLLALTLVAIGEHRPSIWIACWAASLVVAAAAAATLGSKLPRGRQTLPKPFSSGSIFFWLLSAAYLASSTLDRLIMPTVLSYAELGRFAAMANLVMGFEVLTTALGYLLVPRFGRQGDVALRREMILPGGVALVGVGLVWLLGPWVAHLVYSGRYDSVTDLLLPLSIVGVLRVLYVVPSAVAATRFMASQLARLLVLFLGLIALHVVLLVVLLPAWGLIGAVVAAGAVAALRLAGGTLLAHWRLAELRRPGVQGEALP